MAPSLSRIGQSWIYLSLLATSCRQLEIDLSTKTPNPAIAVKADADEKSSRGAAPKESEKSKGPTELKSPSSPKKKPPVVTTANSSPDESFVPPPPNTATTDDPLPIPKLPRADEKAPVPLTKASAKNSPESLADSERELERVGRKLAEVNPSATLHFRFETLRNPRPRIHHTPDGHIYVTAGMLKEIRSTDDLAGILALEMAELVQERRRESPTHRNQSAEPDGPMDPAEVDALAKQLLNHAGFQPTNLISLRERVRQMELAQRPKENYRPLGPAMAN